MTGLLLVHFFFPSFIVYAISQIALVSTQGNTLGDELSQTSPSLITPLPSLKWSCSVCFSTTSVFPFQILLQTPPLTAFQLFPYPSFIKLFLKSSQSCYPFYFITQTLSLSSSILLLFILPSTSNPLSSQLSGFFSPLLLHNILISSFSLLPHITSAPAYTHLFSEFQLSLLWKSHISGIYTQPKFLFQGVETKLLLFFVVDGARA